MNFFYPIWAVQSLDLVYITSATAVIGVLSSVFHPFNLRYNKLKWQVYMSGTNLILYLIIAYFLSVNHGLIGFTFAVLLSNIYNFMFQIIVYFVNSKEKKV